MSNAFLNTISSFKIPSAGIVAEAFDRLWTNPSSEGWVLDHKQDGAFSIGEMPLYIGRNFEMRFHDLNTGLSVELNKNDQSVGWTVGRSNFGSIGQFSNIASNKMLSYEYHATVATLSSLQLLLGLQSTQPNEMAHEISGKIMTAGGFPRESRTMSPIQFPQSQGSALDKEVQSIRETDQVLVVIKLLALPVGYSLNIYLFGKDTHEGLPITEGLQTFLDLPIQRAITGYGRYEELQALFSQSKSIIHSSEHLDGIARLVGRCFFADCQTGTTHFFESAKEVADAARNESSSSDLLLPMEFDLLFLPHSTGGIGVYTIRAREHQRAKQSRNVNADSVFAYCLGVDIGKDIVKHPELHAEAADILYRYTKHSRFLNRLTVLEAARVLVKKGDAEYQALGRKLIEMLKNDESVLVSRPAWHFYFETLLPSEKMSQDTEAQFLSYATSLIKSGSLKDKEYVFEYIQNYFKLFSGGLLKAILKSLQDNAIKNFIPEVARKQNSTGSKKQKPFNQERYQQKLDEIIALIQPEVKLDTPTKFTQNRMIGPSLDLNRVVSPAGSEKLEERVAAGKLSARGTRKSGWRFAKMTKQASVYKQALR